MIDEKLLLDIFRIPAKTGEEISITKFVQEFLVENKKDFVLDGNGLIYNISNIGKPLICAHLDTVQDVVDCSLAKYIKVRDDYIFGYGNIGADDKCGIYIILSLLKELEFNFLFTPQEEIGGLGAQKFINKFGKKDLSHIPYALILDRRGCDDIICEKNSYGTRDFEMALASIGAIFGYSPGSGTFSDADYISEVLCSANLSVGYYNPHSKNEFAKLSEISVAREFVARIILNIKDRFNPVSVKTKGYASWGNYQGYTDYDFEDMEVTREGFPRREYCDFCDKYKPTKLLKSVHKNICTSCLKAITNEIMFDFDAETEEIKDLIREVDEVEELQLQNSIIDG